MPSVFFTSRSVNSRYCKETREREVEQSHAVLLRGSPHGGILDLFVAIHGRHLPAVLGDYALRPSAFDADPTIAIR